MKSVEIELGVSCYPLDNKTLQKIQPKPDVDIFGQDQVQVDLAYMIANGQIEPPNADDQQKWQLLARELAQK